jgi:hypothetical protein
MHNESMAEQIVDGTAKSINGDNTTSKSMMVKLEMPVTYLAAGVALVAGVILGKKFNAKAIASRTAKATHEVADKVEEVAA